MFAKNILFLDLGGSALKGIVINEKKCKILAKKIQEDSGISNGYILNTQTFQHALKTLIKDLEKSINSKISHTVLLIGGKIVQYKLLVSSNIKIESIIDKQKMHMIDLKIKQWIDNQHALLISSSPIEFQLDGIAVENPFGLYADELKFTYFLAYANMNLLGNLVYLLEKQGLDIIEIMPAIYASAILHLSEDERMLGGLVFDIGAHNINWAYYFNNKPIAAGCIQNIGSEMITNKITKSLKVSIKEARKIKHEHASATLKSENFCAWVEFTKDQNSEFILESEIIRKIAPEINAIVSEVVKLIAHFSSKAYVAVLSGRGAWLNNLVEVIQKSNTQISVKLTPSSNPEFDALNSAIIAFDTERKKKEKNILQKATYWLRENL